MIGLIKFRRRAPRRAWSLGLTAMLAVLTAAGCARVPKPRGAGEAILLPPTKSPELEQRAAALAHYATGLSHDLNDRPREGTDEFLKSALADLRNEGLVLDVSRRLLREQRTAEATNLLKKAIAPKDAPGSYYAWLGLAYLQTGQTNLALKANAQSIQRAPDHLGAHQNLAALHLQLGETNKARAVLRRAATREKASPEFLVGLVDLIGRFNRQQLFTDEETKEHTLQLLDAAGAQEIENPLIIQRIADLYLLNSLPEKAEPLYARLHERFPNIPGIRERLANIYIRTDKNDKAAQLLEEIRRENPTDPSTYFFLGSIAYEAKEYDKAADHYGTALKLNPEFEPIYYDLAGVHLARSEPAEALALLEQARRKFKLNFTIEFYSGIALGMMENWPEALARLSSAELIAKTSEPQRLTHLYYYQLGSAYERSGNITEAVKALRRALELSPNYADALNYLGYTWADRGENLDEALSMIERAIQIEPDNAAFLDSLAWVLYKLKRPNDALAPMQKAIALSEEPDATLLDHLGDIWAELKKVEEAEAAYRRALAVKPDEKIQEKLDLLLTR
jgi:tetratricopeptide (TPR) repeat protein